MISFQDIRTAVDGLHTALEGIETSISELEPSGGSIYSTTEQLVGKWIDDKDLYEKTYHVTFDASSTFNEYVNFDFGVEGFDTLFVADGFYIGSWGAASLSNEYFPLNWMFDDNTRFGFTLTDTKVRYDVSQNVSASDIYFTIKYTKPTV